MKKIALLVATTLLLSACKSSSSSPALSTDTSGEKTSDLNSISAQIASGKPISCTMSKKDGSSSMAYMMKDKKIKVTGITTAGEMKSQNMITDGTYMYTWDVSTKKGMKISLEGKDLAAETRQQAAAPQLQSDEDKKKFEDEGYDVKCEVATIDDAEFVPPSDVTFSDLSSMMEQSKKMMVKPDDSLTPEEKSALDKQTQEMMKQYQQ